MAEFATRINVPNGEGLESIRRMNKCLANTVATQLAAKYAHWNVKGPGFHPAHLLFDEVSKFLLGAADTLGERITALGGVAEGLITDVHMESDISYTAGVGGTVTQHTEALANCLGRVSNGYRDCIELTEGDKATQDVFIELSREADKMLYFLEASLQA